MKVYVIEGGIGRHIFFSALIPQLAKDEKIIVMSSYPDIYDNNPYVYRSLNRGTQYMWEDVILKPENEVCFNDPYFNSDFIKRKIHVLDAWSQGLNIDYNPKAMPQLYLSKHYKDNAELFKAQSGEFIIVQFCGGQSPLSFDPQQPHTWDGFKRDYSFEKANALIKLIKSKYPSLTILNYTLPNEYPAQLEDCTLINAPFMLYPALLQKSLGFIGINSSLTHMAAAVKTKGIVLWGGSSHKQWGYEDLHINLNGECNFNDLYCSRPYLRDLGDFVGSGNKWMCGDPTCMEIEPSTIFETLDSKLIPKNLKTKLMEQPEAKEIKAQNPT